MSRRTQDRRRRAHAALALLLWLLGIEVLPALHTRTHAQGTPHEHGHTHAQDDGVSSWPLAALRSAASSSQGPVVTVHVGAQALPSGHRHDDGNWHDESHDDRLVEPNAQPVGNPHESLAAPQEAPLADPLGVAQAPSAPDLTIPAGTRVSVVSTSDTSMPQRSGRHHGAGALAHRQVAAIADLWTASPPLVTWIDRALEPPGLQVLPTKTSVGRARARSPPHG